MAPIGTFVLFLRDFDSRWLERFWQLYQSNSEFRVKADSFYKIGSARQCSDKVITSLSGWDEEVGIDRRIVNAIWAMNAQGFRTLGAFEGGAAFRAYVMAELLPPELGEVAEAAGFSVSHGGIRVVVPMTQPLAAEHASEDFCRMLDDWSTGNMGPGSQYAGWQKAIRTCSLIPLPVHAEKRERSDEVTRLIRKSLHGKANFQDFAKLRSGRDVYSRASEGELLDELGLKSPPGIVAVLEGGDVRKTLRWMCRGLPEGLALRKVAVDNELTERAREKSKKSQETTEGQG